MAMYCKKKIVVAMQIFRESIERVKDFALNGGKAECSCIIYGGLNIDFHIPTQRGVICASNGDWIIKNILGEISLCGQDIFEKKYEIVK